MRRTPLSRSKTPLRRGKGLRPQSAKRRREQAQRREMAFAAFGPNPVCEIRWDADCTGWADALHEIRKRSRGGSIVDLHNVAPACNVCNGKVEDFPAEAERRGWSVPSWGDAA